MTSPHHTPLASASQPQSLVSSPACWPTWGPEQNQSRWHHLSLQTMGLGISLLPIDPAARGPGMSPGTPAPLSRMPPKPHPSLFPGHSYSSSLALSPRHSPPHSLTLTWRLIRHTPHAPAPTTPHPHSHRTDSPPQVLPSYAHRPHASPHRGGTGRGKDGRVTGPSPPKAQLNAAEVPACPES